MTGPLTLDGPRPARVWSFLSGLGMAVASFLTIQHFFAANYPVSIWEGSFCDISAFFNCDSSAFSVISQIAGVPLGYFGLVVGALVALGALFPSEAFERTNRTISLINILGVAGLLLYSVIGLGSLCLLCSGYYLFSGLSFFLFWRYGTGRGFARWLRPSLKYLAVFAVVGLLGAWGMRFYHDAKRDAQSGAAGRRFVEDFYSLPVVGDPSLVSPYWSVRSTEQFEDAPIRIVAYEDFRCPDCLFLQQQLEQLEREFAGKMNVAFQFFPLEATCNSVVEKDLHPGACELSWIAAYDPEKFKAIHDEIWANFSSGRSPEWRRELAARHGVSSALTDPGVRETVGRIIATGAEYEKTSERFSHGIRSTPTMILNGRLVIGTFPLEQLRSIFQALVDEQERGTRRFLENWEKR